MAVWTTARARTATVGPGDKLRMASSVSSFQTNTRLSPVAARAGCRSPMATRPRASTTTSPRATVSLRIYRPPFPAPTLQPARRADRGLGRDREGQGRSFRVDWLWFAAACNSGALDRTRGPSSRGPQGQVTHNSGGKGKYSRKWTNQAARAAADAGK